MKNSEKKTFRASLVGKKLEELQVIQDAIVKAFETAKDGEKNTLAEKETILLETIEELEKGNKKPSPAKRGTTGKGKKGDTKKPEAKPEVKKPEVKKPEFKPEEHVGKDVKLYDTQLDMICTFRVVDISKKEICLLDKTPSGKYAECYIAVVFKPKKRIFRGTADVENPSILLLDIPADAE